MKKILLSVILFFVFSVGFSQATFKVLANKGKNEMKSGASWQPIKVGASLGDKDEIKVAPNSYLGLVHIKTGKPLELKEAGPYTVTDLEKKIPAGVSVMAKYTDFILSSNSSPNSNLKATGAVHRGPENINVYLPTVPSMIGVYGNEVIINWDSEKTKGPFTVTLTNNFEDELKTIQTADNYVTINLADKSFAAENFVRIKVESKTANKVSPDQLAIRVLAKAEKEKIKKTIDEEVPGLAEEQTALAKVTMAAFFESQKLLVDAATAYQQAIKLAPDVQLYQDAYQAFLHRTSLKESNTK